MSSIDSGDIVGIHAETDWQENQQVITKRICLFDPSEPDVMKSEIYRVTYLLPMDDINEFMTSSIKMDLFPILFATGDGFICVAPNPVEEPIILLFQDDASVMDTLILPYSEVLKTNDEIDDEKQFIEAFFYQTSGYTNHVNWTPLPNHPMIASLGVDCFNRIWVQRGFEQYPTFDLYNTSGEHLMVAVIPDWDDTDHWKFSIFEETILATSQDPKTHYLVYIINILDV
jgi:hypothetical protein